MTVQPKPRSGLTIIEVTIPLEMWEDIGKGRGRTHLLSDITINGVPFHIEAVRVIRVGDDWEAIHADDADILRQVKDTDPEIVFQSTIIGRYPYIVWATSFSE